MFDWFRRRLQNPVPSCPWSVRVADGIIWTSDGQGTTRQLPFTELTTVVIATDDSGPWGDDFVFLLYSESSGPVGIFPLEADGRPAFVDWLSSQEGYSDSEMRKAAGSTNVARFVVYERAA